MTGLSTSHNRSTTRISVTIVTATRPTRLTKQFTLDPENVLRKTGGGILVEGDARIHEVGDLTEFGKLLTGLRSDQAMIYGVADRTPLTLTTREIWFGAGCPDDVRPRTAESFQWSTGPGILMLDHDPAPDGKALDRDALVQTLRSAVPGLANAKMLWWPSASSHIVQVRNGSDLTGLRGQRLYLAVADARDIPRAGRAIVDALWLQGHGRYDISTSGSLLERTIFDASVWQTNRLDFAAGASCGRGLRQERGAPQIVAGSLELVDSKVAIPCLDPKARDAAERLRAGVRQARAAEAQQIRESWTASRAEFIIRRYPNIVKPEIALRVALRAVEQRVLSGAFPIVVLQEGVEEEVSVDAILDEPGRFHGFPHP